MPFCRLLYTSRCVAGDEAIRAEGARAIARHAAARNAARGLTGLLLLVDGRFVQLLEGPTEEVEAVFEAIARDFRHDTIKVADVGAAPARLFAGWGMAFVASDPARADERIEARLAQIAFSAAINAGEAARQMRELLDLIAGEDAPVAVCGG